MKRTDAPAWRPARSASALGEVLHKLGRSQDAERYLVDSYRVLVAESAADQDARQIARQRLTRFYADMGQPGSSMRCCSKTLERERADDHNQQ